MINRIKRFLDAGVGGEALDRAAPGEDPVMLAAAALMTEVARMDDHIEPAERARIVELLSWRFGLEAEEAEELLHRAEGAHTVAHWHHLTQVMREHLTDDEREQIVELLWDVVLSDGRLHHMEDNLMRRVVSLLHVSDRASGFARQRARQRHGLA